MRTPTIAGLLALTLFASCAGPAGQDLSAGEYREMEREAAARLPGRLSVAEAEKQRREIEDRSRKIDERRADQAHQEANLAARRAVLEVDHSMALADEKITLEAAERDVRLAQEDLSHFQVVESERRVRRSMLNLQSSSDRLLETREELAQLELMYGASQLGDATAEIVVERTRRRLMLTELRHKLVEQEAAELETRTLPRELEALEVAMLQKTVALQNVRRRQEKDAVQRETARRDLEFDVLKSARETAAIAEDARLLEVDRKDWNRDQDDARRGGTP